MEKFIFVILSAVILFVCFYIIYSTYREITESCYGIDYFKEVENDRINFGITYIDKLYRVNDKSLLKDWYCVVDNDLDLIMNQCFSKDFIEKKHEYVKDLKFIPFLEHLNR